MRMRTFANAKTLPYTDYTVCVVLYISYKAIFYDINKNNQLKI